MKQIAIISFFSALLLAPALMSGNVKKTAYSEMSDAKKENRFSKSEDYAVLYDSLKLNEFGLNEKAFQYAWKGYLNLLEKGKLTNTDYMSICDFSQSSRNKRLYIIDLRDIKLFMNTYVAHGRNSGGEFARYFSNRPESHKSSLGFFVTGKTYLGQHGLSLQITGLEKGINDKANSRRIVMHGSKYVGDNFLNSNPFSGRSYGCPAIPSSETDTIINTIKEGSCLFIYHPSKLYLTQSKILKG